MQLTVITKTILIEKRLAQEPVPADLEMAKDIRRIITPVKVNAFDQKIEDENGQCRKKEESSRTLEFHFIK